MINLWLWKNVKTRAKKFAGIWELEEHGFENVKISGKHFAKIYLKSKSEKVKDGSLYLMTGELIYLKKRNFV